MVLESGARFSVVGEAGDGATALAMAVSMRPDVVVADIHLPGEDGIAIAGRILALRPATKIVFLSSDADLALVRRALETGGKAYLLKENAGQDLIRAIEAALKDGVYLCPEIAAALLKDYRQQGINSVAEAPGPAPLSERELEVLRYVAEGLRNKEIADRLEISPKSVETYRSRLLKKLGYASTAELVRHAIREGLVKA